MRYRFSFHSLALAVLLTGIGLLTVLAAGRPGWSQDDADIIAPKDVAACLECHGDAVDHAKMQRGAHGALTCQQCHRGVNQYPHPEQAVARKPACADCHATQMHAFAASVHGRSTSTQAPNCATCHGKVAHDIAKIRNTPRARQQTTCKTCHAEVAAQLGHSAHGTAKLDCLTCHGGSPHAVKTRTAASQAQDASCRACHAQQQHAFAGSAHDGKVACTTCHGKDAHHTQRPAPSSEAGCAQCHPTQLAAHRQSVHGNAKLTCSACHGSAIHAIKAGARGLKHDDACRSCHTAEVATLKQHAHGLSEKSPGCLDCHGTQAHAISDPTKLTAGERNTKCTQCHADVAGLMGKSVHGMPLNTPNTDVASESIQAGDAMGKLASQVPRPNCVTCHGSAMHTTATVATLNNARERSCESCHTKEATKLTHSVHAKAASKLGEATRCLTCHGKGPHTILLAADMRAVAWGTSCVECHAQEAKQYRASVHARPDKQAGDHPNCVTCHGQDIHGMQGPPKMTARQRMELCSKCHGDTARMARYGMTTDAVTSYQESFHGKSVMRFHQETAAVCTDCHGLHGVRQPDDPAALTGKTHVTATCGKCHPGAQMNFALSGANHLRLRIEKSNGLSLEEWFFKLLTFGVIAGLLAMIALDLRRKAFSPHCYPVAGRRITLIIALSFTALVSALVMGMLGLPGAQWAGLTAIILMGVALVVFAVRHITTPRAEIAEPGYQRFTLAQRVQHICLMLSFSVLVLTGMPIRFADVGWARALHALFGGIEGARYAHRIAAVVMIATWIFHTLYLLYRWRKHRFSLKSWTMFPNKQDFLDFFQTLKFDFGLSKELPKFDRFQFREKFDYFAVYWGMPIMVLSGLVLWFPVYFSNLLSSHAFGVAYIAHSDEALLAMLAIVIWHFYNTHFTPDNFPMNPAWLTGRLTEAEMQRDHPLELARMQADAATADVELKKFTP